MIDDSLYLRGNLLHRVALLTLLGTVVGAMVCSIRISVVAIILLSSVLAFVTAKRILTWKQMALFLMLTTMAFQNELGWLSSSNQLLLHNLPLIFGVLLFVVVRPKGGAVPFAVLAYLVYTVILAGFESEFQSSMIPLMASFYLISFLVFYFIGLRFGVLPDSPSYVKLAKWAIYISSLFACVSILQAAGMGAWYYHTFPGYVGARVNYGGISGVLWTQLSSRLILRSSSVLAGPVQAGAFFVTMFLAVLWTYRKRRVIRYTLLLLIGSAAILSYSRSAIILLVLECILYFTVRKKYIYLIGLLGVCGVVLWKTDVIGLLANGSTSVHVNLFFNGLKGFLSHPFGTGIGSVGLLQTSHFSLDQPTNQFQTESGIFQIPLQVGYIGFALFLLMFGQVLSTSVKLLRRQPYEHYGWLSVSMVFFFIAQLLFLPVLNEEFAVAMMFFIFGATQYLHTWEKGTNNAESTY